MMKLPWRRQIAACVVRSLVECGATAALRIDAAHALLAVHQIVLHVSLGGATASNDPKNTSHKEIARHYDQHQQAACKERENQRRACNMQKGEKISLPLLTENHEENGVSSIEHARCIAIPYALQLLRIRIIDVCTKARKRQKRDDHRHKDDAIDALLHQLVRDVLQREEAT